MWYIYGVFIGIIHSTARTITLPQISENEKLFTNAEWVVIDANVPTATMKCAVDLATRHNKKIWYVVSDVNIYNHHSIC